MIWLVDFWTEIRRYTLDSRSHIIQLQCGLRLFAFVWWSGVCQNFPTVISTLGVQYYSCIYSLHYFQNRLEANRQALTDLFVQLMEEKQRREEELAKRLVRKKLFRRCRRTYLEYFIQAAFTISCFSKTFPVSQVNLAAITIAGGLGAYLSDISGTICSCVVGVCLIFHHISGGIRGKTRRGDWRLLVDTVPKVNGSKTWNAYHQGKSKLTWGHIPGLRFFIGSVRIVFSGFQD